MLRRARSDDGNATVEFVLVASLLTLLVITIIQISLALYVRNVVIDAAGEGARHGALLGGDEASAVERTQQIITASVSEQYAQHITAQMESIDGTEMLIVTVEAPIPMFGLLGVGEVSARGHGVLELL